jgi:hypothetical protein
MAGVGIDLDLGDVTGVGERLRRFGLRLGVERFCNLATLLHLSRACRQVEQ